MMSGAPSAGVGLVGMTFVITGAAQGIGAATARMAAGRGANVVVADVDDDTGTRTVADLVAAGGKAVFQHCDVTDVEQVRELMRAAYEAFGGIDVLHNNAGIHDTMLGVPLSVEEMPIEAWDRVVAVNLRGTWLCAKFAVPYLKQSRRGPSIINAGSTQSLIGGPSSLAYGASKGGVAILTKSLAVDLAKYGIRVNCYCPSATETRMLGGFLSATEDTATEDTATEDTATEGTATEGTATEGTATEVSATEVSATEVSATEVSSTEDRATEDRARTTDDRAARTQTQLVARIGQPDDIANLVCFLASAEAAYVNGAVWLIDGGSLAWRGTR
jgi:NAD(P)-dependent dehydrogenase (short-subunit alcohol dehydrogenase family)